MELFEDPVVLGPCAHVVCAKCMPSNGNCPECNKKASSKVKCVIL